MPALRSLLRAKIHRARVTQVDRDYEGSITIDEDLLRAADIAPFERVLVANVTNGARFETYAIAGPPRSGVIGVNGAAAHLAGVGDLLIVMAFALVPEGESVRPRIVVLDAANRPQASG
jgi:aspartate 1-decarboxylase